MSFALKLRDSIAKHHWKSFGKRTVEGTFIYFNGDMSEIFFPSSWVLDHLEDYKSFSDDYVLSSRTDSIPYHFELMISFDNSDSTRLFFNHPVQQFLSVEETGNFIPSVQSTEMWTTMVIHEMFHQFQYNNLIFRDYAKLEIGKLPFDVRDLRKLCEEDESFLNMVQLENELLMKAIAEKNNESRQSIISNYLNNRSKRIENYGMDYPHLEQVENYYILQEGSARYMEYLCMKTLSGFANQSNAPVSVEDPKFKNLREFRAFDLSNKDFNYLTYAGVSTYHYAIGFNLIRLMDLLDISFKEDAFDNPKKGLHMYLEDYKSSTLKN